MIITSFDVGVVNMAVSVSTVRNYRVKYQYAKNTDLRKIHCKKRKCLYKSNDKTAAHRIMHYLEQIHKYIKNSNVILIELQPLITGLTNIEQALYIYCSNKYPRATVKLISPNAVYKHFEMSKSKQERIEQVIERHSDKVKHLDCSDEPQHVCDCVNITEYYVDRYIRGKFTNNPFSAFIYQARD